MTTGDLTDEEAWERTVSMSCPRGICWLVDGHAGPCEPSGRPHPEEERTASRTTARGTDPVPALILSNLRRVTRDAQRRRVTLDPVLVLAIIEGKAKA